MKPSSKVLGPTSRRQNQITNTERSLAEQPYPPVKAYFPSKIVTKNDEE